MELYVYPPIGQGLSWHGVIDQFGSLRWRRKYTEPGEFELHLPASKENVALLRPGARLQRLDCREQGEIAGIKLEEMMKDVLKFLVVLVIDVLIISFVPFLSLALI